MGWTNDSLSKPGKEKNFGQSLWERVGYKLITSQKVFMIYSLIKKKTQN